MINGEMIGEANLARKLAQAGRRAESRVMARAQKLGEEMAEKMRDRAPEKTGELKASIRVEPDPENNGVIVKAGGTPETTRPSASGGHSFDVAVMTNFGTQHQPANPFFSSVANEYRGKIAKQLGDEAASAVVEIAGG